MAYRDQGLVYSGALWDARVAAGADAALVDAAAMRVIPAAVAAGGAQVRDVARELLAGADAKVKDPLEAALRLHGLLEADGAAPVIETPVDTITLRAGAPGPGAGPGLRRGRAPGRPRDPGDGLDLGPGLRDDDAPGRGGRRADRGRGGAGAGPRGRRRGAPRDHDHGPERAHRPDGSRTIAVTVAPSDAPLTGTSRRAIRAQAGQVVRTPLASLFDPLQGTAPATREPS